MTIKRSCKALKVNKPPFPIKFGLLILATTRKVSLVNNVASDGLSISYNLVEEIQNNITKYLSTTYNKQNVVCPSLFENGYFMVIAIDNIDNNHHRRHLVHLFMALPYRFFKKTRNRVEKEKANIDINLDEGEEEFKTLPEYYTTIHQVREGGGGGGS